MIYFLYFLFIASCITLIASVLLQPGKSDAGALFTSSVSSTAFGPRGTLNILSKITIGAAAVFMLSAFLLGQPALTGDRSVLDSATFPSGATESNTAVETDNATGANPNAEANNAATVGNTATTNPNATASNANAAGANAGNANAATAPATNQGTNATTNTAGNGR